MASLAALLTLSLVAAAQPLAQQDDQPTQAQGERMRGGVPGGQMVRGSISAVATDSVTVKTEDGQTLRIVATPNTRILKQRQPVKLTDLKPGDGVGAAGVLDSGTHTLHAAVLFAVDAADVRKAQENLGKTYITGHITAIDDLRLTIARPDGVSQVIEVDEGTSFRRGGRGSVDGMFRGGATQADPPHERTPAANAPASHSEGESITLADLKVGDTLFATGSLKSGTFHPVDLRVAPPRRRNAAPLPTPQP